jgi:serine/threonine-protein kinase
MGATLSLAAGDQLGAYRIVAPLGAGGMGEVFRATDTRLGRDVALKRLPPEFASDPDRLARFEREAKLLASLQHPNIATLFGLEDVGGERVLAMELVAGQDLKLRLEQGPLPVDEALAVARQVAEALEEAHEHGIVHRDLKPANVTLTPDGKIKVLDFGLAKAWKGESGDPVSGSAALSESPTLAHTGTAAGLILGTAAYMSPEQARGRAVDKRSDIWSFGVLLHEMLTGRRLFDGETVSDVLAGVLKSEVDWSAVPAATPPAVRHLLGRCLERDPKRRLRDIGEARLLLESGATAAGAETPTRDERLRRGLPPVRVGIVALVAATLGAVAAWTLLSSRSEPPRVVRLVHPLPAGYGITGLGHGLALSPGGTRLVYASDQRLYLRALDSLDPVAIPGTEDATEPSFSPDGEWLVFTAGGSLKKVSLRGGGAVTIAAVAGATSWARDGTILLGAGARGVLRLPAGGGDVVTLVAPEPGYVFGRPQALPDGRSFLYTRRRAAGDPETFVRSLDRDDAVSVLRGAAARYALGHLVFARGSRLHAIAFDPRARRTSGSPVMVEEVRDVNVYHQYFFALSDEGTLAYVPDLTDSANTRLVAVSATGAATSLATEPRFFSDPRLSPDGTRVAVHLQDDENDVWVADPARGSLMRLSSDPGEDETPAWSRDGRFIAWTATRADVARGIYKRAADASGGEELLWTTDAHLHVNDWSPDGTTLLVEIQGAETRADLHRLRLGATPAPEVFVKTRFGEHSGRISPSGRHVAYVSDESGREEVYLQSFPDPGGKLQVSTSGGTQPLWSHDGRSLFFRGGGSVQAVAFKPGPPASVSVPRALFADRFENPQVARHTSYDVFPDGRFLMIEPADKDQAARRTEIVVVLDFLASVEAKLRGAQP